MPPLKIDLSKYDKTMTVLQNNSNSEVMNKMIEHYITLLGNSKDSYEVTTDTDMNKHVLNAVST